MEIALLARHGESNYSARGLLNGDVAVQVGLTAAGVEQARTLGDALRDIPIEVAVTSGLERAIATADEALRGRSVRRVVLAELNDPLYGVFEGRRLEEYRAWAASTPSTVGPDGGGESRRCVIQRYARAFRDLLGLPEGTVVVVCHSLPVSYALLARDGGVPTARMPLAAYATAYPFTAGELASAADVLERWLAAPSW
jgi:broad specificity phosphatase PhoE